MNVSLKFNERIGGWIKLELEQLVASIKTGWDVEHYTTGLHKGASGTFTTVDGKTVTVVNGIITSIV